MANETEVINAAQKLHEEKDDSALEILIGLREKAIQQDPALTNDPTFEPKYEANTMGALDDVKALGRRILMRWNKELYGVVCSNQPTNAKERQEILGSLGLGEAAVIGAVATALLSLGVTAAIAAPLAPLLVRKFIWPAKDELCGAWGEALKA